MKLHSTVVATTLSLASFAGAALADTTGPGATLYKLNDRWVSVLPATEVAIAPPPPAPAPAPAPVEGFRPPANYSGACHVTVDTEAKTYVVNETSSTDMVGAQGDGRVCMPTERLAIDAGFSRAQAR